MNTKCFRQILHENTISYNFGDFLFLGIFAVSHRFNDEVKHIKVIEKDSWIHITEAKKFESLLVSHVKKTNRKFPQCCMSVLVFNLSLLLVLTGAGGVLSVSFT